MQLSPSDLDRVRKAIAAAELKTSGEIICVVTPRCGDDMWAVFFWAMLGAICAPLLWLGLGGSGEALAAKLFSEGWQSAHATAQTSLWIVAFMPLLGAVLVALLLAHPTLRRIATPRRLRRKRVHHAALQQFVAQGVAKTEAQTGVLIFLALAERQAEVVADQAIYDKVAPEAWGATLEKLLAGARASDVAGGFVAAIDEAGRLLSTHFPAADRNPDELPDHLILLP